MTGALFLIDFVLLGYCVVTMFDKLNTVKLCLYWSAVFICEYCVLSSLLLVIDTFSVNGVLLLILLIHIFLLFVRRNEKLAQFIWTKECGYFIIALLFLLPWISMKGETLRTGSDVGFYFSKAIDLMFGDTKSVKTIEEFGEISKGIDNSYLNILSAQYFDFLITENTISYTYHSLYIWPAVLALFGSVFGFYNSPMCLTFLYVGVIGNMCYSLHRIANRKYAKYLVLLLIGFSPPIIYLAKLTFSEMLFIYILTSGILFLTDNSSKWIYLSGIMFGTLETLHFSTIMYLPIILCILVLIGVIQKEKKYYMIAQITLLLFIVFFVFNFKISPMYSPNQMMASFGKLIHWKIWVIIVISCAIIGFGMLCYFKKVDKVKIIYTLCEFLNNHSRVILQIFSIALVIGIIYQAYLLGFTDKRILGEGSWAGRAQYANQGMMSLWHTNIYSIGIGLSYIGLPFIYYKLFTRQKWTGTLSILYSVFFYALALYTFLRSDTPSNYYGSRYFAIFLIPVGVILICCLVKSKKEMLLIGFIAIVTSLPYNLLLKDTVGYLGSKDILKDTIEYIEENAIVLMDVDNNTIQILANNLQEINGNKVYDIEAKQEVQSLYIDDSIYLISNTRKMNFENEVMHKTYKVSGDIACFDTTTTIVKYPLSIRWSQEDIYIYIIQ